MDQVKEDFKIAAISLMFTLHFSRFSESADFTESADGATPGSPVTKQPSMQRSGAKPTIVTPLENIEVNDGENVTIQVSVPSRAVPNIV